MFGGLAFLVGGHMAVAASGKGGLMVRCDPADSERLVGEPGASRMEMRGKEMDGWLRVTERRGGRRRRPGGLGRGSARRTPGACRPSSHPGRLRSEQGACGPGSTYALFGVLATLVGMAAGHLVASLLNPASSPVLAVGSQVIDLTPTPMKEWAIRNFGCNDKRS